MTISFSEEVSGLRPGGRDPLRIGTAVSFWAESRELKAGNLAPSMRNMFIAALFAGSGPAALLCWGVDKIRRSDV